MQMSALTKVAFVACHATIALSSSVDTLPIADGVVPSEVRTSLDARTAHEAAENAEQAAAMARHVASQSVKVARGTHHALKTARDILHMSRVHARGLSPGEKITLESAEARLSSAARPTHFAIDGAKIDVQTEHGHDDAVLKSGDEEVKSMENDLRELRNELANCGKAGSDKSVEQMDAELRELQDMLKALEEAELRKPSQSRGHDALRTEIQHLRESVRRLQKAGDVEMTVPQTIPRVPKHGELHYRMPFRASQPRAQLTHFPETEVGASSASAQAVSSTEVSRVASASEPSSPATQQEGGIDVDMGMPYGELEPFGREDTAQELTEASIRESDEMVDQLERAEVAEEKRAVFRALTRLRGAAITSFDGVARSQTGNIDEYNKVHKWRSTHPLRHLASEESDVSKWAFPDAADF
jgi:hypothetical protein